MGMAQIPAGRTSCAYARDKVRTYLFCNTEAFSFSRNRGGLT